MQSIPEGFASLTPRQASPQAYKQKQPKEPQTLQALPPKEGRR
ncbi:hypothetical protein YIM730264_12970 [Thermus hydrothermalis]